jgi:hypothetical protein
MELLKKISDHEIKLILVFLTLIIFVGSYQLGYQRYHQKAGRLSTENMNLRIQMNELQMKEANKDNILKNTSDMVSEAASLLEEFPLGLPQEKSTLFISALAGFSGMKISTISFGASTVFYSEANTSEAAAGMNAASGTDAAVVQPLASGYTGYKTAVMIAYQATYEGMKKSIRYINEYEERMNLVDLTASFDNTTGNLTGVMTIELYAVTGTDRVPEEPVIQGVQLGTDNIFGSFEIPMEGAVFDE